MSPSLLNKEADNAEWFQELSDGFQLSANQYKLSVPQYPQELHVSELFSFKSSQSKYTLHGLLYKPDNFQMGVKYPCLLYVYAGPQVSLFLSVSFHLIVILGVRTLRPKTLRPRTLRPNVNYAQGNYDNVISYAHIPLVP